MFLAFLLAVGPLPAAHAADAGAAAQPAAAATPVADDAAVAAGAGGTGLGPAGGDAGAGEAPGSGGAADGVDARGADGVPDAVDAAVGPQDGEAAEAPAVPDAEGADDAEGVAGGLAGEADAAGDAPADAVSPDADAGTPAPAEAPAASGALTPASIEAVRDAARTAAKSAGEKRTAAASASSLSPAIEGVSGSIALLVIVMGFLGDSAGKGAVAYEDGYDWGATVFADGTGVSAYYSDMSGGKFTFVPAEESSAFGVDGNTNAADRVDDGVVHVALPEAHGNWRGDFSDPAVAAAMLRTFGRAVSAADASVDFKRYDADGNGAIDRDELAIAFVVAGYEAAQSDGTPAGTPYSLWSHAWSFAEAGIAPPMPDGTAVFDYIAIAEKLGETTSSGFRESQEPLSALMHELGHYLGLPDLYDTGDGYTPYDVGDLSLMDSGNWAGVEAPDGTVRYIPSALDAWSRYQLGWTTPVVVRKSGVYTVSAQGSKNGYQVLLIPTKRAGEYYLVENRTFAGWDAGLAASFPGFRNGGLVIWHIDNGIVDAWCFANGVNNAGHRPGVMPLYPETDDATGKFSLSWRHSFPATFLPFWSSDAFAKLYPGARMLTLPLYGQGGKADKMDARVLSGIRIEFLSGPGSEMKIRVIMPADGKRVPANAEPVQPADLGPRFDAVADGTALTTVPATGDGAAEPPALALLALCGAVVLATRRRLAGVSGGFVTCDGRPPAGARGRGTIR